MFPWMCGSKFSQRSRKRNFIIIVMLSNRWPFYGMMHPWFNFPMSDSINYKQCFLNTRNIYMKNWIILNNNMILGSIHQPLMRQFSCIYLLVVLCYWWWYSFSLEISFICSPPGKSTSFSATTDAPTVRKKRINLQCKSFLLYRDTLQL